MNQSTTAFQSNYQFTSKFITKPETVIWESIRSTLKPLEIINSIKNIEYKIVSNTKFDISYKAKTRKEGEIETINKSDLIPILIQLKTKSSFNTDSAKEIFNGPLYRKRSPVFAILLACGVIKEIE